MSDTKKEYEVTSPIKRDGKRYEVGDIMLLTEEQAKGLNVQPAGESSVKASNGPKVSPSMGLNATAAINTIGSNKLKDINGFVIPEPEGSENRKTVLEAWSAKLAEESETGTAAETQKKSSPSGKKS